VRRLRVGVCVDDGFMTPAPALRRAVREAGDALGRLGVEVAEFVPPDVPRAMAVYLALLSAPGTRWARRHLAGGASDRRVRDLARLGALPHWACAGLGGVLKALGQRRLGAMAGAVGRRGAAAYLDLVAERESYRARFLSALAKDRLDALVCPPSAHPALTHGASYELTAAASYSMLYNLLGVPAGVVAATCVRAGEECDRPRSRDGVDARAREVELASAGLPVGVQVVAPPWRDDVVLALMAALEEHFSAQPDYPAAPPFRVTGAAR
jgi:fatty acid amide hydrolase